MKLYNRTPIPARLFIAELGEDEPRIGTLIAKVTFRIDAGSPVLDQDSPFPVFDQDEETPLGLLPRDDLPRFTDDFEVLVLGCAHAPRGTAVQAQAVSCRVGDTVRTLYVYGDREWLPADAQGMHRSISAPLPFERMPLTWDRAFGGSTPVLVAEESPMIVGDPRNLAGRGFDPAPAAESLRDAGLAAPGFPRFDTRRPLPNLEDPQRPVQAWTDAPDPICWATLPLDSGMHGRRLMALDPEAIGSDQPPPSFADTATLRAHPDWVIPLPPANATVQLQGMSPDGDITFSMPAIRVFADYVLGTRTGTRELRPAVLVLLPEEQRFYLVFRLPFNYEFVPGEERAMRVRAATGWFEAPARTP